MATQVLIPIFGGLFLLFRIWLSLYKLREELQFRRFYVSRLVNYYFCMMLIFNLQSAIFNVIIAVCFPAMIFTSVWDYNFYSKFKNRTYWKKNRRWLFVERITMHPPLLISGLYMYIAGIPNFVPPGEVTPFLIGILIVYGSSFLLDVRLRKRYNWPNGRDLLIVMLVSTIGFSMYYIFG
ncbi:hypothetical protein [Candidatus Lokiarchaeum ossiferum]|uniref:hypothetical protein n=1 Tax=Candidatus Lokiarchaeum ossiferum TaxID=2951803 RepID=UPI00352FEC4E